MATRDEIQSVFLRHMTAIYEPVSADQVTALEQYFDVLKPYPVEALERGWRKVRLEHKGIRWPRPAVCADAVREFVPPPDKPQHRNYTAEARRTVLALPWARKAAEGAYLQAAIEVLAHHMAVQDKRERAFSTDWSGNMDGLQGYARNVADATRTAVKGLRRIDRPTTLQRRLLALGEAVERRQADAGAEFLIMEDAF